MSELFQGLLINLLFILLSILLLNLLILAKHNIYTYRFGKLHLFLLSSLLMIVSILLSVKVDEGFVYDLRFIPFLLGCIYGGRSVILGLASVMILIRLPFGGNGIWVTTILAVIYTVVMIYMYPNLLKKPLYNRLFLFTFLSFLYSVIGFLIPSILFDFDQTFSYFIYVMVLTASTFFVCYLCEVLRTFHLLQMESIKFEKMETVSHLAASISHEVRNPLTVVRGFLQLVHEHSDTPEDCKTYTSLAIAEADRASEIINEYLTFARPHPEVELPLELEQEIQKCVEIIRPLANKQGITIETAFLHNHPITGDPHKFQQILLNISKNGIDAMKSGGILFLFTKEDENGVHLSITDTGIGMTSEQVARLGEPFFSLKGNKGTGLGMMVVYRIVESMRGTVHVNSKPMKGTRITLSFPIEETSNT